MLRPKVREVATQLSTPWELVWAGDDQIWFSELGGRIARLDLKSGHVKTLYQNPQLGREMQAGQMGLALHPDFPKQAFAYAAATYYEEDNLLLKIDRLSYHASKDSLLYDQTLVQGIPANATNVGGRLLIDPSGHLLLSVGDRGLNDSAQKIDGRNGKILRYQLDGRIPSDNPIPGNPLWAYGFRNPQGLAFAEGQLFGSDHGTFNKDEINRIAKGANYGWPLVSGQCREEVASICEEKKLKSPLMDWTPTVAPSGMDYYGGHAFEGWHNSLLLSNLKGSKIKVLRLDDARQQITKETDVLADKGDRIRDVLVSPEGRIFYCSSNADSYGGMPAGSDRIFEILPQADQTEEKQLSQATVSDRLVLDSTVLEIRVLAKKLRLPWDMVWGPDDNIWFSERGGSIKRLDPVDGRLHLLYEETDVFESKDNSGMHAFALHPRFPDVPYAYVHYTYELSKSRLVRLKYLRAEDQFQRDSILMAELPANVTHNGSRIQFAADGSMFFCLGDAYKNKYVQRLERMNGKILRIWPDGSIPEDNPFPGSPVWSFGHRNPQGMVLASNGKLYASEHGPSNDDELNLIVKGRNYGWPKVHGYCDLTSEKSYCKKNNVVQPLIAWTPTHAPAGLDYYDHPAIPEWRNSLLQVFLKGDATRRGVRLKVLKLNKEGDKLANYRDFLIDSFGRLRDVLVAPDGRIFLCTSNRETNGNAGLVERPEDDLIIELRAVPPSSGEDFIQSMGGRK
ncbi:MAG: PQQ-dependent sugar dehydrogenase [Bacteroidota bacterium]